MKKINDFRNSNYIVRDASPLKEAMEAITINHRGSAVVVDDAYHVIGVVTDGMIRRALLKGAVMETAPVRQVVNYNTISVSNKDAKTLKNLDKFFLEHWEINVVPVVNEKNVLVDIIIRGGSGEDSDK